MRRETIDFHFHVGFKQIKHTLVSIAKLQAYFSQNYMRVVYKLWLRIYDRWDIAYMWTTERYREKEYSKERNVWRGKRLWDVSFSVYKCKHRRDQTAFYKRRTLYVLQTEALFVCAATFMYIMNRTIKHCLVRDAHRYRTHTWTRSKLGMTCWRSLTSILSEQKKHAHTIVNWERKWKKKWDSFICMSEEQTPILNEALKKSRPFLQKQS